MEAKRYWLIHYKQRRYGRPEWIDANEVTDKDPGAFLAEMLDEHEDNESRVLFAIEIPAASYECLKGRF